MEKKESDWDKKRRLEVEKLQFQVNQLEKKSEKKQKNPHWIFPYLQPLIPTIFTLASLVITCILLYHSHLFTANNTFLLAEKENLNAQKENLIRDIRDFKHTRDSLSIVINSLGGTIIKQHADSIRLTNDNRNLNENLKKSLNSLKPKDKQIAELGVELSKQKNMVSNYYGIISNFKSTWVNFQRHMEEGQPYVELRGQLSSGIEDIFNAAKYNKP